MVEDRSITREDLKGLTRDILIRIIFSGYSRPRKSTLNMVLGETYRKQADIHFKKWEELAKEMQDYHCFSGRYLEISTAKKRELEAYKRLWKKADKVEFGDDDE